MSRRANKKQKKRRPRLPRYVLQVKALHALGVLGPGVHAIDVLHDDGCGIFVGRACACRYELRVRVSTPGPASLN